MTDDGLPEGWLVEAEVNALAELARDRTCLEIGSWVGRSTVCMARVAKLVVAVDHHHGPPYDGEGSTLQRFLGNLALREIKNVVPVLADSGMALPLLRRDFDLAFIDGNHEYVPCLRDGLLAWQCVKAGGWLVFHDYFNFSGGGKGQDGVCVAVDELCERWGVKFENPAGSLAVVIRKVA